MFSMGGIYTNDDTAVFGSLLLPNWVQPVWGLLFALEPVSSCDDLALMVVAKRLLTDGTGAG